LASCYGSTSGSLAF